MRGLLLAIALHGVACTAGDRAAGTNVPVELGPRVAIGDTPAARAGVRAITATGDARDAALLFGRIFVATPGGLLVYNPGGAFERALTFVDGLAAPDAVAMTPLRGGLALAGRGGVVTLLDERGVQTLRLPGEIDDLAALGDTLVVAVRGTGIVLWDGQKARALRLGGHDVTALAGGPDRVAAATADGRVWVVTAPAEARLMRPAGDEAATALAWDGDALLVGSAAGVDRFADGRRERLARGTAVTALLAVGGRVYAGTADSGVMVLGAEREERLLGRARVTRLRLVDGSPVALGPGLAWRLDTGAPLVDPLPAPIADGRISAVAVVGDRVWVGGPRGVDLLDADGAPVRHLDLGPVRALRARGVRHEVVAATARGAFLLSAGGEPRRLGADDGLVAEEINDTAWLAGVAAYATDRGLVVIGADGGARARLEGARLEAVAFGASGQLFAGGGNGLAVFGPELQPATPLLAGASITALCLDAAGGLVAGASDRVVRLDPAGRVAELGPGRLAPRALLCDGDRVYAGTAHELLVEGAPGGPLRSVTAPLAGAAVTAVGAGDGGAVLWIGTDRGLLRVPRGAVSDPDPSRS